MRWPFGPPHLTLKRSKQNKTKTKQQKNNQKNIKKTKQQHPTTKPRTKQTKQKQKQHKKKTNTRNTKTPKPSKPRWTTMSHPRKTPKNWKKTSIFNTFSNNARHTKNKPFNIKTSKKTNPEQKKNTILPCSTLTHYFSWIFCLFSTYSFCFEKLCFCWKHYKNSVFRKTQLFKNTVSKTHFFNHVKKHPFPKKGVICAFLQFPLKPPFL